MNSRCNKYHVDTCCENNPKCGLYVPSTPIEKHTIIKLGGLIGCSRCKAGDSEVRSNPYCRPQPPVEKCEDCKPEPGKVINVTDDWKCPKCGRPVGSATPPVRGNWEEEFDNKFPEGTIGHKHTADCEWSCVQRPNLKAFIRQTLKQTLEDIKGEVEALMRGGEITQLGLKDPKEIREAVGIMEGLGKVRAILADKIKKI